MSEQIRVMIVDDHEVVREGLRALLNRRTNMTVVAEAHSVESSIAEAQRARPDVIVMDVRLGDGSGVEACREIRAEAPATRVIMLTSYSDEDAVIASILAGASGYLLKQTRGQALADAIGTVASGESLLDPAVTANVMERLRSGNEHRRDELSQLSGQEQRILGLIAEGKTNKEIATEIYLSHKTVKNYVSSILSKLNLRRRSEAAAFVARHTSRYAH
ncbi:MAG: response regulator transcription factor [Chloroflexi bacterium]|nr:response regulator transcription factor [Chloroflexota bacterium]